MVKPIYLSGMFEKVYYVFEGNEQYLRRNKMSNLQEAGPFVKWAGGKAKLIDIILEKIGKQLNLNYMDHYIEPFVGGGAMFFHLAKNYKFQSMTIMDINLELINVYKAIKENPIELTRHLDKLQNFYNRLITYEGKESLFYEVRKEYNCFTDREKLLNKVNYERAAQFIFLNKTCYNGLYRVNKSGGFNVPFGKKDEIQIYNDRRILGNYEILQNTEIISGDYSQTSKYVQENTFIYFDPPYRPITNSAAFTAYSKSGFNDNDQRRLAKLCSELVENGVYLAVSNSNPKNSDPKDNFFEEIYDEKKFEIYSFNAARQIAASTKGRKSVSEVLIVSKV